MKRDKIEEVLNYHGYKVSEACLDALTKVEDETEVLFDSWGYPTNDSWGL